MNYLISLWAFNHFALKRTFSMRLILILTFIFVATSAFATDLQEGFAVVKKDTIYGIVKINFEAGSIIIKQDSINRMFINGVESVTFFNENRDTYYTYSIDSKIKFYKAIVTGKNPLIEQGGVLYCVVDNYPTVIEQKNLYLLFGKKKVKEYAFVRNLSLDEKEGLIDLFSYFNDNY